MKTSMKAFLIMSALAILASALSCNKATDPATQSDSMLNARDTTPASDPPRGSTSSPELAAPCWAGTFTFLWMRTGMTKLEAFEQLGKFRDIRMHCQKLSAIESCTGSEKELSLILNFEDGRLITMSGEDKYSPFGAFAAPYLERFGTPDLRTESEIRWSSGRRVVNGKQIPVEMCKIYLRQGNADIDITRSPHSIDQFFGRIHGYGRSVGTPQLLRTTPFNSFHNASRTGNSIQRPRSTTFNNDQQLLQSEQLIQNQLVLFGME